MGIFFYKIIFHSKPLQSSPVVAPFKAWNFGCAIAAIVGSNPAGSMDVYLL
jgi:hypothetical protein